MDHLQSLYRVREELDAWGQFAQSELWIEHFPEPIEHNKNPTITPHPLWLAVVDLQAFYPKNRLPKLTGALDAWARLLKYSRRHGDEDQCTQRDLAVKNGEILCSWVIEEIARLELSPSESRQPDDPEGKRRIHVDVEAAVVTLDGKGYGLNGTPDVKRRLADFLQELINQDGEYIPRPSNIKTCQIECQPEAVRDLIESQPGAGTRIPRDKIWLS